VPLADRLRPWTSRAYRHITDGARYDILDLRWAGRGFDNRWNEPGEPTLYLAGDHRVVMAEFARHFEYDRAPNVGRGTKARRLYSMDIQIERMLDLRDPEAWTELALSNAPHCFLERPVCRSAARYLRTATQAQGLLVPSVGLLDDLERWVAVLFLERLPDEPGQFLTAVTDEGLIPGIIPASP
jgi:RES domain-containing protein